MNLFKNAIRDSISDGSDEDTAIISPTLFMLYYSILSVSQKLRLIFPILNALTNS